MRLGIVFGGPSAEHTVSCSSAASLLRNLPDGMEPVLLGIDRDGVWRLVPEATVAAVRAGARGGPAIDDRIEAAGEPVELRRSPGGPLVVGAGGVLCPVDVVFPVLHGPFGEDGVLQGYLETVGVPYVGCGVLGSAVGMDKVAMKRALAAEGVPITPYAWIDRHRWRGLADPAQLLAGLSAPWFVKPANMGSSLGVSMVTDPAALAKAVEDALGYDEVVLVEEGVPAPRELECGVLGGDEPLASCVGEVAVSGGWFDHEQKYFGRQDPMTVPAVLPDGVAERARELSLRAFRAIGGWGLARVDFLWDPAADRLVVNELNTMPGFTAHSMYPKVWAADGLAYPELVQRLVELALQRHARRAGRAR